MFTARSSRYMLPWMDREPPRKVIHAAARPVTHHAQLRRASVGLIRSVFPLQPGIGLVGVTLTDFDAPVCHGTGLPLSGLDEGIRAPSAPVLADAS
jgi:DNA polymerase-4